MKKDFREDIMNKASELLTLDGIPSKVVEPEEVEAITNTYNACEHAYFYIHSKVEGEGDITRSAQTLVDRIMDYVIRYSMELNIVEGAVFYKDMEYKSNKYIRVSLLQQKIPWSFTKPHISNEYSKLLGMVDEEEEWNNWLKK